MRLMKRGIERDVLIYLLIMIMAIAAGIALIVTFRGSFPGLGGLP